jgi:hypothetical protein
MGYIAHHALVITDYQGYPDPAEWIGEVERYREQVNDRMNHGNPISDDFAALIVGPVPTAINDDVSFFVVPDGSKEGWGTSDLGERMRSELIEIAEKFHLDYALVRFGGDDPDLAALEKASGRTEED